MTSESTTLTTIKFIKVKRDEWSFSKTRVINKIQILNETKTVKIAQHPDSRVPIFSKFNICRNLRFGVYGKVLTRYIFSEWSFKREYYEWLVGMVGFERKF